MSFYTNHKTITHKQIKVYNMNKRPNQFIIDTPDGKYFQSYESIIAFIDNNGQVFLDQNRWDYSTTTGKYRNIFLGENKKLTEKRIDANIYSLVDLNN